MDADQLFRAGQLSAAIAQLTKDVKARPADRRARTFLFELLCFSGNLDRAGKQLEALGREDVDSEVAVQRYRQVLEGERARRRLFSEGLRPRILPEAPSYAEFHFQALNLLRQGKSGEARDLLRKAEAAHPAISGKINGNQKFRRFNDCDELLGPFLEAIIQGEYNWIPWEAVASIHIAPPKHSRDLIWIPAHLELRAGAVGEVFLPALYTDSYLNADDAVKLGRVTDWRSDVGELALGLGQRLLAAENTEWPMLEVREIAFNHRIH